MQVAELSLQDWDDFVCVTPQSSAYAKSTFLGTMPCKLNLLHFDFGGGQQLGAIISNPDQVDSCSPYPYTCYQGLFRFPTSQNYIRDTNQLAEALEFIENKFSRLCFSLHPSFNDIRAIQWHNYGQLTRVFKVDVRYTAILDLSIIRSQGLHALMSPNRRQDLKKGEKFGVIVSRSSDVKTFLELYQKTFSRQDIELPEINLSYIEALVLAHLTTDKGRLYIASNSGVPTAACMFINDDKTAYYAFGAQDPQYKENGSTTAVLASAINDFTIEGYSEVDMVGINSPGRGNFKLGFGALPQSYFSARLF